MGLSRRQRVKKHKLDKVQYFFYASASSKNELMLHKRFNFHLVILYKDNSILTQLYYKISISCSLKVDPCRSIGLHLP